MARRRALLATLVAVSLSSALARARSQPRPEPPALGAAVGLLQRLSIDLRGHTLSATDRTRIEQALRGGTGLRALYRGYVDRWLDVAAYRRLVVSLFPKMPTFLPAAGNVFMRLVAWKDPKSGAVVHYLPHTRDSTSGGPADPPCAPAERVEVRPWWSKRAVTVCQASYRPERSFDEAGYCAGQAEPTLPQPPRAGCGCGPLLLACLPPEATAPKLEAALDRALLDELVETGADIVAHDRPYDELVTATRTWQSGLTRFMYLRRELIGRLQATPYSPALQGELERRVDAISLSAPARWVEREAPYRGTGLWFTPVGMDTLHPTYRNVIGSLFKKMVCVDFSSVNVDSEALLRAVGAQHAQLRALSAVNESPMRTQVGCKGCHAPMDNSAGFLAPLQMPLMGSQPTGNPGNGQLYLKGAEDHRGDGVGIAGLAALLVKQPEFADCAVQNAARILLDRAPLASERVQHAALVERFRTNGHRWGEIVREILLSSAYAEELR